MKLYIVKLVNGEVLRFEADGYDGYGSRILCFYRVTSKKPLTKTDLYEIAVANILYIIPPPHSYDWVEENDRAQRSREYVPGLCSPEREGGGEMIRLPVPDFYSGKVELTIREWNLLKRDIAALEEQRDDLLEACEMALEIFEAAGDDEDGYIEFHYTGQGESALREVMQAAIAKAQGES